MVEGLDPTGARDAALLINSTLERARGIVYVPDGDYLIRRTITVPEGKTLQLGSGRIRCEVFPCFTYSSGSSLLGRARGGEQFPGTYITGSIPPGSPDPSAPTIEATCAGACGTIYKYAVVAYTAAGHTSVSPEQSATNAALLDSSRFNSIKLPEVPGSTGCHIWRTAPFPVHGKITRSPVPCGSVFVDDGKTGDLGFAFTANTTGGSFIAPARPGVTCVHPTLTALTIENLGPPRPRGSVGVDWSGVTQGTVTDVMVIAVETGIQVSGGAFSLLTFTSSQFNGTGLNFDATTYENTVINPYIANSAVAGVRVYGTDTMSFYTPMMVSNPVDFDLASNSGGTTIFAPRFEGKGAGIRTTNGPECGETTVYSPFVGGEKEYLSEVDGGCIVTTFGTGRVENVLDGSSSEPSLSFRREPKTGLFRPYPGVVGVSIGGSTGAEFGSGYAAFAGNSARIEANGTSVDYKLFVNGEGSLRAFSTPAGGGLTPGEKIFSQLPACNTDAAPKGTLIYCADCKNAADDKTGVFDSPAAPGGHGTMVMCGHSGWRVR